MSRWPASAQPAGWLDAPGRSPRIQMKLVAISVGRPRDVQWRGRNAQTSIYKTPVSGRVHVTRDNVEGDQQSDLSVHGGPDKAVYGYPAEHYSFWRRELPDADLPWGAFGENFTTEGPWKTMSGLATVTVSEPSNSLSHSRACRATSWRSASDVPT